MAASDHLGPQFYHASPYAMKPGTVMTPATNAAHGSNFGGMSSGNTYFTPSLDLARRMGTDAAAQHYYNTTGQDGWTADRAPKAKMYEVRPTGAVERDMNLPYEDSYESPDPVTVLHRKVYYPPYEQEPGATALDKRAMRNPKPPGAPVPTLADRELGASPRLPEGEEY